jgi:hypothetical protein
MCPTRYSGTDRGGRAEIDVRRIYYWLERGEADFEAEVDSEYAEFCQW